MRSRHERLLALVAERIKELEPVMARFVALPAEQQARMNRAAYGALRDRDEAHEQLARWREQYPWFDDWAEGTSLIIYKLARSRIAGDPNALW